MKLNVDLRHAFVGSGIGNYKRNIIQNLSRFKDVEITGCFNIARKISKKNYQWFDSNLICSYIPDKLIYGKWHIPIYYESMFRSVPDLNLFLTYGIPNVKYRKPVICTIHDLIILKAQNERTSFIEKHERILRHSVNNSMHILTVSNSSREDISEYFRIPKEKISIVHNGIDFKQYNAKISNEIRDSIRRKYNLPDFYILYLGGYRKHKNIESLLKAYSCLNEKERKVHKLVITNHAPILQKQASELGISEDVVFTGFVDESDKAAIYQMASMVYYASYYEGWGVPILEAQASGVPVLTSSISSMPEASGGCAVLINPYKIDEIIEGMRELLNNQTYSKDLVNRGINNARQYTWKRGANELYNLIKTEFEL